MYYRLIVNQNTTVHPNNHSDFNSVNTMEFKSVFLGELLTMIQRIEELTFDKTPRYDGILGETITITGMSYVIESVAGHLTCATPKEDDR